jgi:hypothetical protein
MGDLAAMIMSMDTLQLAGIGLATMGSIGLIAYGVLKKKPTKETVERTSALSDAALNSNKPNIESPQLDMDETYTVNTQEELSHLRPRLTETPQPAPVDDSSAELLESALVYDGYGSKEEALQMLYEAMRIEQHAKEKVRLHVIYKNYQNGTESLSSLVERFPTFLKKQVVADSEQSFPEPKEQFDLFAVKKDNPVVQESVEKETPTEVTLEEPVVEPMVAAMVVEEAEVEIPVLNEKIEPETHVAEDEAILSKIVAESAATDEAQAEEDSDDTAKFFEEFGDLAKQIQKENQNSTKSVLSEEPLASPSAEPVFVHTPEKPVHDVWANYMSLFGGRMNLKNTFIHLDHAWGTISGIAELQEKINNEIGKDTNGNQIPWAIISVLPLKDTEK